MGEIAPTAREKLPTAPGMGYILYLIIYTASGRMNRSTQKELSPFTRGKLFFHSKQRQIDRRAANSVFSAAYRRVYSA